MLREEKGGKAAIEIGETREDDQPPWKRSADAWTGLRCFDCTSSSAHLFLSLSRPQPAPRLDRGFSSPFSAHTKSANTHDRWRPEILLLENQEHIGKRYHAAMLGDPTQLTIVTKPHLAHSSLPIGLTAG